MLGRAAPPSIGRCMTKLLELLESLAQALLDLAQTSTALDERSTFALYTWLPAWVASASGFRKLAKVASAKNPAWLDSDSLSY